MQGKRLEVTFIDVGWGDSILIEARDDQENATFALVDSNDTPNYPASLIFLKRRFERLKLHPFAYPMFEHVLVSHAHADHVNGIQSLLRNFGSKNLYASKCDPNNNVVFANLERWVRTAKRNKQPVIQNPLKYLSQNDWFMLGPVRIDVLWPPFNGGNPWDANEENNNSLVLALTLDSVRFVLTGDCLAENWDTSRAPNCVKLPSDTRMVQAPHHGARNGTFDASKKTPLLDQITAIHQKKPNTIELALSCHIRPHKHPHVDVVSEIDTRKIERYRTDEESHTTFRTDGSRVEVCYSHT